MSIGFSLLSFIACGSAPETTVGGVLSGDAFDLTIRPAYLSTQAEMIDEITNLNVVITEEDGWTSTIQLIQQDGTEAIHENFPPLENATLTLLGRNDAGIVFHGQSKPISVSEGDHVVSIFVARGGEPVRMPPLPQPSAMGALVSLSEGRFYGFGGTAVGLQSDDTNRVVVSYDIHSMAEGNSAGTKIDAELPATPNDAGWVGHTATVITGSSASAGKVLLAGGADQFLNEFGELVGQSSASERVFLFDTATETFERTADLTHARLGHTATTQHNGEVVVVGGFAQQVTDVSVVPFVEIYDPTEGVWEVPAETFQAGGIFHTASQLGDSGVLVCGGIDATLSFSDQCQLITPNGAIQPADDLDSALIHADMTTLADGRILLTGGLDPAGRAFTGSFNVEMEATSEAWMYESGSWRALPSMRQARAMHSTSVLPGGRVIISGGVSQVSEASDRGSAAYSGLLFDTADAMTCVEIFDPETETFTKLDSCTTDTDSSTLPHRTALLGMVTDPYFGTLIAGGLNSKNAETTDEVVLFYPNYSSLN